MHSAWAHDVDLGMLTFHTRRGQEVDFVVTRESQVFAVEVKSSDHLSSEHYECLEFISSVYPQTKGLFIFHLENKSQKFGKFGAPLWQEGLQELGL